MKISEALKAIEKEKAYKHMEYDNIRMFPSDPTGSLDDFFLGRILW